MKSMINVMPEDPTPPTALSSHDLPTGYTFHHARDGSCFAVPEFLVMATHTAFDAHHMKSVLHVDHVSSEPHIKHGLPASYINAGTVMAPVDPTLSNCELVALLAEAKALKERYGITLKDACHRLYMAETAKLETIDTAQKTLAAIQQRIDKASSQETMPPIDLIDKGEFDEHVLPYGKWPRIEEDPAEAVPAKE
ncbi:hypothetical protein BYT27DRAFT_7264928 [Phlegmacium glaucopus]|nr:hypothetical protein BYT27DRAFT_7264928 [Phlegmacium glaucopus]